MHTHTLFKSPYQEEVKKGEEQIRTDANCAFQGIAADPLHCIALIVFYSP